jgi:uncharacterized protein with HEPN domain
MRDDRERLSDIQEAIANIEKYAQRGREAFEREELIQTWILHYLLILGEAVRGLSPGFRKQHPEVVWPKIVGMRNILIHSYFDIDLPAVWSAVEHDVPTLKRQLHAILREMK